MELVEGLDEWIKTFQSGWLEHLQKSGKTDFKQYVRPNNREAPAGRGVWLSRSRLLLISSAGAYLKHEQTPFDADNLFGDYEIRTFPTSTPFSALAYAHTHYDHSAVDKDPQVLLPLRHLEMMVEEGLIGELVPTVISFGGYQPDVARVVQEVVPQIVELAHKENAQAALLVPA